MNNILCLTIIAFVLLYIVLKTTNKELFSCSSITLAFLFLGSFLLYIQSIFWEIDISNKTLTIFVCGLTTLTFADCLSFKKYQRNYSDFYSNNSYYSLRYSNVLIFTYFIFSLLYYYEIRKIGSSLGYDDIYAIGEVKAAGDEAAANMNPIIRQSYKIVTSASYIHCLIFANNVFLMKSSIYKEIKHMLPFFSVIIITLSSGGRLNIFKVMTGIFFIFYLFMREDSHWQKLYIKKMVAIVLPTMFLFVVMFSAVGIIVKNKAEERKKIETFEYISYYAGSPIQAFNLKINDGIKRWQYERFGYYTFSGLYKILGLEKDKKSQDIGNGMVYLGGNSDKAGNAMTILGGFFFDFNLIGMCIALFFTYYFLGSYYYKNIVETYSSYDRNKKLLIYTYIYVSIIVLAFYDNCFYILFSTTGLLTLFVLILMFRLYFNKLIIYDNI